jgi:hypothetical protein
MKQTTGKIGVLHFLGSACMLSVMEKYLAVLAAYHILYLYAVLYHKTGCCGRVVYISALYLGCQRFKSQPGVWLS